MSNNHSGRSTLFGRSDKKSREDERAQIRENRKKILNESSVFAIREAYVQLRTNLMYSVASMEERGCNVFGVTSPNPSEGKSLTASNIAVSFAMLGKKTLLIDCDMRKPNIGRLWKISTKNGLSDLIAKVDVCDVFQVEGLPLFIIPCGKIPPNPSEMLASASFQNAIDRFREQYEYIIIDTAPIKEVADAQIVSRVVDGMVLIIRSGKTKQRDLMEAEAALQSAGSRICGVVINDQNPKVGGKYGYHYAYKYAYGYGARSAKLKSADSDRKERRPYAVETASQPVKETMPTVQKNRVPEIDFHAHILPGCDHGSGSIETSLTQVAMAKDAGVDVICATSHFYGQETSVDQFLNDRANCLQALRSKLGPDSPKILPGAEVLAFEGIENLPRIKDLCLSGTDILLLEMPFSTWSERLIQSVEALSDRGDIRIVLAHVDRYDSRQVEVLFGMDRVKGQVNVASISKSKRGEYLRNWIREGKVIAVGSDIHGKKVGYSEWQMAKHLSPKDWAAVMQATYAFITESHPE